MIVRYTNLRKRHIKHCLHCGKPVLETVGNCGYCKKCIALAKKLIEGAKC